MFTFLPYHADELYRRFLQIVSLPSHFAFLSNYHDIRVASTLPPVPRQLFIRALSKNSVFLEAYFASIVSRVKSGHGYPAMIVKWTSLAVEAILQMRQARVNEETIVSRVMPFIAEGLQIKQSSDFQIANYTVLTVLASNRTLTDTVIDAAMEAICQGWTDQSRRLGILCLVTLAQNRESQELSDTVVQSLLLIKYYLCCSFANLRDFVAVVESFPPKVAVSQLLVPIANRLLVSPKMPEVDHVFLTRITFSKRLSSHDRHVIIQSAISCLFNSKKLKPIIGKWLASCAEEHAEDFKVSIAPLISTLDTGKIEELENYTQLSLKVKCIVVMLTFRIKAMTK